MCDCGANLAQIQNILQEEWVPLPTPHDEADYEAARMGGYILPAAEYCDECTDIYDVWITFRNKIHKAEELVRLGSQRLSQLDREARQVKRFPDDFYGGAPQPWEYDPFTGFTFDPIMVQFRDVSA